MSWCGVALGMDLRGFPFPVGWFQKEWYRGLVATLSTQQADIVFVLILSYAEEKVQLQALFIITYCSPHIRYQPPNTILLPEVPCRCKIKKAGIFSKGLQFLKLLLAEIACFVSKLQCFLWPLSKYSNNTKREHEVQKAEGKQRKDLKASAALLLVFKMSVGCWHRGNAFPFWRTSAEQQSC